MAITNTETTITYPGGAGGTTVFPVPFPIVEKLDLDVSAQKPDGELVQYTYGQEYDVTLNTSADGFPVSANVVLNSPLSSGWQLIVDRTTPVTQETRFALNDGYLPEEVEKAVDRLTMIAQEQAGEIGKCGEAVARANAPAGAAEATAAEALSTSNTAYATAGQALAAAGAAVATANDAKAIAERKADKTYVDTELAGKADKTHALTHLTGGTDPIPVATLNTPGLMSAADKARFDGLFPANALTFYLDPNGDTSPNTPGTPQAPFGSVSGALSAIFGRYGNLQGGLGLILNPGEYAVDNGFLNLSPLGGGVLGLFPADPNNVPVLTSNSYWGARLGTMALHGLHLKTPYGIFASNRSSIHVTGSNNIVEITGSHPTETNFFRAEHWSEIQASGGAITCINSSPDDKSVNRVFSCSAYSQIFTIFETYKFQGFAACGQFVLGGVYAYLDFRFSTLDVSESAITGMRYHANAFSTINTGGGGANFIPGTIDGSVDDSSRYY